VQDSRQYSHKNGQAGGQDVVAPLQTVTRLLKRENYHRELLSDPDVVRATKTIVPWRPIEVLTATANSSQAAYSSKCDSKSDSSSGSSSSAATSVEDKFDSTKQCDNSSSMMKSQLELQQEAQAKEEARARVIAKHALQAATNGSTSATATQGTFGYVILS
jgi:hypothetical protein